jgi:prepilin-type N-terminal cleavage/methylation domain-containing protein
MKYNKSKGFTLPEVMLATAIFAFIIIFLIGTFLSINVMNNFSVNLAKATNLANEKITELKLKPYSDITAIISSPPPAETIKRDSIEYTVNTNAARLSTDPNEIEYDLIEITVNIQWYENKSLDINEKKVSAKKELSEFKMQSVISPATNY